MPVVSPRSRVRSNSKSATVTRRPVCFFSWRWCAFRKKTYCICWDYERLNEDKIWSKLIDKISFRILRENSRNIFPRWISSIMPLIFLPIFCCVFFVPFQSFSGYLLFSPKKQETCLLTDDSFPKSSVIIFKRQSVVGEPQDWCKYSKLWFRMSVLKQASGCFPHQHFGFSTMFPVDNMVCFGIHRPEVAHWMGPFFPFQTSLWLCGRVWPAWYSPHLEAAFLGGSKLATLAFFLNKGKSLALPHIKHTQMHGFDICTSKFWVQGLAVDLREMDFPGIFWSGASFGGRV